MNRAAANSNFILWAFLGLVVLHALAAYSVFGVPLQWVAQTGFVFLFVWVAMRNRIYTFPGFALFLIILGWALAVTGFNYVFEDYQLLMPAGATTGYSTYLSLRFLNFLFFFGATAVVYWLCRRGYRDRLISLLVDVGVLVSVFAFYVYLAQQLGLPEPPRSRGGTGGGEAVTSFTYAFHRAMGSFREPSHLAEWLVVPMFLSYVGNNRWFNIKGLIIGTVILMTGSLTGIIGTILGLVGAVLMTYRFKLKDFKVVGRVALPFVGAFVGFSVFAMSYVGGKFDLIGVIWGRIEPIIMDEGMQSSNRWYIYEYLEKHTVPLLGQGVGNANLLLGQYTGVEASVSFLNLFLSFAYSIGVVGLVLIVLFFLFPILYHYLRNGTRAKPDFIFILGGYLAWLFMFFMHSEELTLFFAVIFALTIHSVTSFKLSESQRASRPGNAT